MFNFEFKNQTAVVIATRLDSVANSTRILRIETRKKWISLELIYYNRSKSFSNQLNFLWLRAPFSAEQELLASDFNLNVRLQKCVNSDRIQMHKFFVNGTSRTEPKTIKKRLQRWCWCFFSGLRSYKVPCDWPPEDVQCFCSWVSPSERTVCLRDKRVGISQVLPSPSPPPQTLDVRSGVNHGILEPSHLSPEQIRLTDLFIFISLIFGQPPTCENCITIRAWSVWQHTVTS